MKVSRIEAAPAASQRVGAGWRRVAIGAAAAASAVLAAWLLQPALGPVHVEGFSASIVSLGLHHAQGTIRDFEPHFPLATDYFGLTKFGAMLAVAWLSPLLGGDGAMRLVMQLGLALTMASSAYLVRTWSGARWWVVAATLLVVPGTIESAFYFNDNLPAAGLLLTGLAVLVRWPSLRAACVAGVLIGGAIAVRIDSVLVAILAVPLIAWKGRDWGGTLLATLVAGAAAIACVFALFATAGVTPFDAIRAGRAMVEVWDRPLDFTRQWLELLYFLGLPGAMLALLGTIQVRRNRQWHRLALLAGVPLMINLLQLGTLWQARQFVTLAPFLGALAACGAEAMLDDFKAGRRAFPAIMAAIMLVALAGPVRGLTISDGPHVLAGRLAAIPLWKDWQEQVRQDFRGIDRVIDMSVRGGAPLVILPDYWNEDRYLHLRLVERGFRREPLSAICGLAAQGFTRDGRTIIAFVANSPGVKARQLDEAMVPCVRTLPGARLVFLADGRRVKALLGRATPQRPMRPELAAAGLGWLSAIPLDAALLETLDDSYRRGAVGQEGPTSLEAAFARNRSRTAFSR